MTWFTVLSLVQVMACHLFGIKCKHESLCSGNDLSHIWCQFDLLSPVMAGYQAIAWSKGDLIHYILHQLFVSCISWDTRAVCPSKVKLLRKKCLMCHSTNIQMAWLHDGFWILITGKLCEVCWKFFYSPCLLFCGADSSWWITEN